MVNTLFLQAAQAAETAQSVASMNLLSLLMKGGWIMIPLFILSILVVFIITDTWVAVNKLIKSDDRWFAHIIDLVYRRDHTQALSVAAKNDSALAKLVTAGIRSADLPEKNIEEDMQVESRQILSRTDASIGYLSMIATIAPMLGFLGTIFGVIKIFFNISMSNDLSISSISDGLYQKMICSGAGLLVGIVAYIGYYILNRRIDKIVLTMDKAGNELLKAIGLSRGMHNK